MNHRSWKVAGNDGPSEGSPLPKIRIDPTIAGGHFSQARLPGDQRHLVRQEFRATKPFPVGMSDRDPAAICCLLQLPELVA